MVETQLSKAINLALQGQRGQAREMLAEVLRENPTNQLAWLWYADCLETIEERIQALETYLSYQPDGRQARAGLHLLHLVEGRPALNRRKALYPAPRLIDPLTTGLLVKRITGELIRKSAGKEDILPQPASERPVEATAAAPVSEPPVILFGEEPAQAAPASAGDAPEVPAAEEMLEARLLSPSEGSEIPAQMQPEAGLEQPPEEPLPAEVPPPADFDSAEPFDPPTEPPLDPEQWEIDLIRRGLQDLPREEVLFVPVLLVQQPGDAERLAERLNGQAQWVAEDQNGQNQADVSFFDAPDFYCLPGADGFPPVAEAEHQPPAAEWRPHLTPSGGVDLELERLAALAEAEMDTTGDPAREWIAVTGAMVFTIPPERVSAEEFAEIESRTSAYLETSQPLRSAQKAFPLDHAADWARLSLEPTAWRGTAQRNIFAQPLKDYQRFPQHDPRTLYSGLAIFSILVILILVALVALIFHVI